MKRMNSLVYNNILAKAALARLRDSPQIEKREFAECSDARWHLGHFVAF